MPDRTTPLDAPPGELIAARAEDLPPETQHWKAVHLTAMEYFAQATLPTRLQELGIRWITLDPAAGLMDPARRMELTTVLRSLHAFLPSEEEILGLHRPHQPDLWECAEELSGLGPWIVVIDAERSADGSGTRPPTLAGMCQPTEHPNATDSGQAMPSVAEFVAGLALTDDPLQAALRGAVSASLAIEGFGALYPLGATPGLAEARLDALRDQVRRV